jgi:hypothetical protein
VKRVSYSNRRPRLSTYTPATNSGGSGLESRTGDSVVSLSRKRLKLYLKTYRELFIPHTLPIITDTLIYAVENASINRRIT